MAYKSALSMGGPEPGEDQKGSAMAQTSSASEGVPNDEALATASAGREEMASKLVHRFALWSGVAGLVPLPVVDVIAVGGLQVQMLRRLSQIYDVEFSENRGKALIAALAGSMIPATSGIGAASMLKFVPVVGTLAAVFIMPVLSAGATYAIGAWPKMGLQVRAWAQARALTVRSRNRSPLVYETQPKAIKFLEMTK